MWSTMLQYSIASSFRFSDGILLFGAFSFLVGATELENTCS
jgi:hypothetical protein